MSNEQLPRCDHEYRRTGKRCTDQARYHVVDLRRPSETADACMAHLAQVVDRFGVDRQGGEYVPLLVRRLPENMPRDKGEGE